MPSQPSGSKMMAFQFVNNTSIDRDARKLIRSHAAKGKNIGKLHPSRKKRAATKAQAMVLSYGTRKGGYEYDGAEKYTIEPQVGDSLSLSPLPIESTPESRTLVRKALHFLGRVACIPGLGNALEFGGPTPIWIRFLFLDQAYFHCSVAMCLAAAAESLIVTEEESVEAAHHLSSSLRLVNERLSGENALSDTTIASVIAMLQLERLKGQYDQALIHFGGLRQMVNLRGGISKLTRDKPALAQKIFRADLEIALYLGSPTQFGVDDVLGAATVGCLRERLGEFRSLDRLHEAYHSAGSNIQLRDVFIDISSLACFLNQNTGSDIKLDVDKYHNVLILIGYNLIRVRPLNSPPLPESSGNAIHLGLLIFMASFLLSLSHKQPYLPILYEQARALAGETLPGDTQMEEVLLWVLFLGRTSIFQEERDPWLISRTSQIVQSLNLRGWDDVHQVFSKRSLPWVDSVHGSLGKKFWAQLSSI